MQTQTFDCSCKPSLSAFRAELAKVEGDLMVISALLRLDIGRDKDEDGFEQYVWDLSAAAKVLADFSVFNIVPSALRSELDALCNMGRKIDAAAWDFFFQDAVKETKLHAIEASWID